MPEEQGNNAAAEGERELVDAARHDPARFAELYQQYLPRIYGFISRRVPGRGDAEDLTAEVFHAVLERLPGFEWRGVPFSAWIFRIAANTIASHSARLAREGWIPNVEDISAEEERQAEFDSRLDRYLGMLPAAQRKAIELRFFEEKSVRDTALEMECSEGAVRQLQFRALETLRGWMSEPDSERRRGNG